MANSTSHFDLPYPIYGAAFSMLVPFLDADGDPADPGGSPVADTEISKDAGAFADCTNEITVVGSGNGFGYISFTGTEMTCYAASIASKPNTGTHKTTLAVLYPRRLPIFASGTASAGAATSLTLASSIPYDITGCFLRTTGGTGSGQARMITAYNPSTQVATVNTWETTPDNTTTYDILLPDGVTAHALRGTIVSRSATAQSGSAAQIRLDANASATTDFYKGAMVTIIGGTGVGQSRVITAYNGSSKQATVDRNWATNPDNTSVFAILPIVGPRLDTNLGVQATVPRIVVATGTAQAGGNNTITLNAGALATDDVFVSNIIAITGGTGVGQVRSIIDYNGTTKVATVDKNWVTNPDATSTFDIYASSAQTVFSDQGVLQSATGTTGVLGSQASSVDSVYVGSLITITSGLGAGQTRIITAYNGTTKAVTVAAWDTTPDSTSGYVIIPTVSGSGSVGSDPLIQAIYDELVVAVGEPAQGAPPATAKRGTKIDYNYQATRNKVTDDGTTVKVFADDESTVVWKKPVADAAGTLTSGEAVTGP